MDVGVPDATRNA